MTSSQATKIWIGNLDPKVSEFQVMKLAQAHGTISSFDFLYAMNDRGSRVPRGYAFVTYENRESAQKAIQQMNRVKICGREIHVRYANAMSKGKDSFKTGPASLPNILSVGGGDKPGNNQTDKEAKIRMLEAKLKSLEDNKDSKSSSTSASSRFKPY